MQDFLFVAVADSLQQLVGEALHDQRVHALLLAEVVHVLLQIVLQIFKNQDEFAIGVDHLPQVHDVHVVQLLQDGDLADSRGGDALLLRLQPDLLEREYLAGLLVWIRGRLPRAL